jgi:hypothetical protein
MSEVKLPRYTFRCLRPDHVGVYDEHVLRADFDAVVAERNKWMGDYMELSQDDGKKDREIERLVDQLAAKDARIAEYAQWHANGRRNIRDNEDGTISICEGLHHRSEGCDWKNYRPSDGGTVAPAVTSNSYTIPGPYAPIGSTEPAQQSGVLAALSQEAQDMGLYDDRSKPCPRCGCIPEPASEGQYDYQRPDWKPGGSVDTTFVDGGRLKPRKHGDSET